MLVIDHRFKQGVSSLHGSGRTPTILIVDDMESLVLILKNGLTKEGYTILTALSGADGLQIFRSSTVDAVVCDLAMEGLTGLDVAQAVRDFCIERSLEKTPFVLLTGWGFEITGDLRLQEFGVDAVLNKPVEIDDLTETLNRVVHHCRPV